MVDVFQGLSLLLPLLCSAFPEGEPHPIQSFLSSTLQQLSFVPIPSTSLHSVNLDNSESSLNRLYLQPELKHRRNHDVFEAFGPFGLAPGKSSCIISTGMLDCLLPDVYQALRDLKHRISCCCDQICR